MKKQFRKILSIFLIIIMLAIFSVILFACNKDNDSSSQQERIQAVDSLESTILAGINSTWQKDMDDNAIVANEKAGEYIVASEWVKFICSSMESSYLQTAKIQSLNNVLSSDDGKKVLSEVRENAELIIPLLRKTGFTSSDVAYLVYSLIYDLVKEGGTVINDMSSKLDSVTTPAIGHKSYDNIKNSSAFVESAKLGIPNEETKNQMLEAISNSESSLVAIVSFAYNMSLNAITEDVYNVLVSEDGALADITDSEIQTFINTLIGNVNSLKASLNDEQLEYINEALSLIIKTYDKKDITSSVYKAIVDYGKKIYSLVDMIPTLCDLVVSMGDVLGGSDFINALRTTVQNYDADVKVRQVNISMLFGKVIYNVLQDYDAEDFNQMIDDLLVETEDYSKVSTMFMIDTILNLIGLKDGATSLYVHNDIMNDEIYGKIFVLVESPNKIDTSEIPELINYIKADLKEFVKDYYKNESTVKAALQTINNWTAVNEITKEEFDKTYKPVLNAAGINGLSMILTEK